MKLLSNQLKKVNYLLFLDIEGTQLIHEVIQLGAVLVPIDSEARILSDIKPIEFKSFCIPHEPVGHYVTSLTGITDEIVNGSGVSFEAAMRKLNKLIGNLGSSLAIVVFGNQDSFMLNNSLVRAEENPFLTSFISYLQRNIFDFQSFLQKYVSNEKNQSYSLLKLLEIFKIEPHGRAHDPLNDAINLMNLYDKVSRSPEVLRDKFQEQLVKNPKKMLEIQDVLSKYVEKLVRGEAIKANSFSEELLHYFE